MPIPRFVLVLFHLVGVLLAHQVWGQQVLSLKASLLLARRQNPDLKVLMYNIDAAQADVTTAKIRPNPIFNLQTLHITNPNDRREGTSWSSPVNNQYWYQVTKPFQLPAQRARRIEFSNKMVTQTKLDVSESGRSIYYTTANKWLDVWAASVNLDILRKGKGYIDSLVNINRLRLKDKVITTTDLDRAQLLQRQYQRNIVTAMQTYVNEIQNLKYLIGVSDSILIDLDDDAFSSIHVSGDSLISIGIGNRSDILSAKNAVDVSMVNIKLQKSFSYPQPEAGMMFNPQNGIPYAGFYGTIRIPVFDRNQGQREKAAVTRLQAEQNLLASERQAETEINTAYRSYVVQQKNLEDYEGNLTQAETILNSVRYSYLRGGTTIIDLLEAQRSWLNTQQEYYSTMLYFRRSYIQLLFTTGIINQLAE